MIKKLLLLPLLLLSMSLFAQGPGVNARGGVQIRGHAGHGNQGGRMGRMDRGRTKATLTQYGFRDVRAGVLAERSHRGRLLASRAVADQYLLTSDQVKRLMVLLGTERDKIDFAKYAFPSVVDIERFAMVKDVLNYEYSRREIDNFLYGTQAYNETTTCGTCGNTSGGCANGVCVSGGVSPAPQVGHGGHHNHGGHHTGPYVEPMCISDFRNLKEQIRCTSFDSDRLELAIMALRGHYVTAEQVRVLAGMMTFESNKLELAKFAYDMTVDPQNYFIVNDVFTFSSSRRELNRYIYG